MRILFVQVRVEGNIGLFETFVAFSWLEDDHLLEIFVR